MHAHDRILHGETAWTKRRPPWNVKIKIDVVILRHSVRPSFQIAHRPLLLVLIYQALNRPGNCVDDNKNLSTCKSLQATTHSNIIEPYPETI